MVFRIYKGKKTNRFLCLLFLILTLIFLIAAGISALLKNPEAGCTFCILAIITGGFSLLFGLLWAVYGRTELKAERKLREILDPQYAPDDPYLPDYQEFVLPKADLIEKAGNRAGSILRWTGICALCVFLLTGGIQLAGGSLKSPLQLLYMLLFCIIIMIPGILIQLHLYRKYVRSVPSRILLFPGKLIIDNVSLPAREIREISVSPSRIFNLNSPDVFRELLIRTEKGRTKYRIDYRAGAASSGQPFWADYGQFVAALSEWGIKNSVPVIISYMA